MTSALVPALHLCRRESPQTDTGLSAHTMALAEGFPAGIQTWIYSEGTFPGHPEARGVLRSAGGFLTK